MGSDSRFKVYATGAFGLGFSVGTAPFAVTISITVLFWIIQLGFGAAYDD
jgi:hypothetical protein